MAILQNSIIPAAAADDAEVVTKSCRFDKGANYLRKDTGGTPENSDKWTMSFWVKRNVISSSVDSYVWWSARTAGFSGGQDGSLESNENWASCQFQADDTLRLNGWSGTGSGYPSHLWTTDMKFRDPAAWYHIVICINTENDGAGSSATADNHCQIFVNSEKVGVNIDTSFNGFAGNAKYPWGYADTSIILLG